MSEAVSAERKPLSKRLRFEVFKRDGFLCQYCGAHPPQVALECDHINPVALGGQNEIDNLVTACEACNRGKSAVPLTDIPQSLDARAAITAEREAQIAGYEEIMRGKRLRIEEQAQNVLDKFCDQYNKTRIPQADFLSLKRFVERLGVNAVWEAFDIAIAKKRTYRQAFPYFCGICWNMIRRAGDEAQ